MTTDAPLFTTQSLRKLIGPLILEQILAVTIGMADTMMVSSVGEAAVSGISLVNTLNLLLINLFAALATGGAVVASQYLGARRQADACMAAKQLYLSITAVALLVTVCALTFRDGLLHLAFGDVDPAVMENARVYFVITALSFPMLAMYNAGAALFRTMNDSRTTLVISAIMNIINVIGNAVTIYLFNMGAMGAALSTLFSRAVGAVVMLLLLRNPQGILCIRDWRLQFRWDMIRKILSIGVPNGLENCMFQFGKVLVQTLIAACGTTAIAADAVANQISNMQCIPGSAISLAMITVVGRCVGARAFDQARSNAKRLMGWTYALLAVVCLFSLAFMPWLLSLFQLSEETYAVARWLSIFHAIWCMLTWGMSFVLPAALRAAGDARFTMTTSVISMWLCRVVLSYVLVNGMGLGVQGVWIAMVTDWGVRTTAFVLRFRGQKWLRHAVI